MQINQFKALNLTQRSGGTRRSQDNNDPTAGPDDRFQFSREALPLGSGQSLGGGVTVAGAYALFGPMPGGGPSMWGVEATLSRMSGIPFRGLPTGIISSESCPRKIDARDASGRDLKSEMVKDASTGRDRCLITNPHGVITELDADHLT